ncbi:MAG: 16S rRNA (uracil(1498)-N(3))-methyltransferase [Cellvibrionales bacterium]|jgi:16S rRNA (uracil1498-N3)-methyltransferase|nr:16S rRNA (uracil(1498)-N(3))-methyltransferase [Cellvibrionales bacterium]MBK8674883.1 16S rRNA (uracil(1498)-N(3))-methyltransferase [Cellvibrionales bacterium]TXH50197.1 MAG: 16S rRNA (uracil(1498)-N(3))-methyltransferase [Cellvibrionales bacterium]HRG50167.1 16S rRNA (uracil(1498)-N(3))-methyltransferase [Pseudomonadales bacterium]
MRITRLYVQQPLVAGSELSLPADAAHHIGVVLRAQVGQPVVLFDGCGTEAHAVITECTRKQVCVQINSAETVNRESPLAIHLAIGVSRGERMEFVLQKSTELGAASITPLLCERSEVRLADERWQKKMAQWQKIMIGACEQSGRTTLPILHSPTDLSHCLANDNSAQRFVLHHRSDNSLSAQQEKPRSVLLVIGPEGGLSEKEIAAAQAAGCSALTLGPRVLRTETAPLAAISVLQARWGDFQ